VRVAKFLEFRLEGRGSCLPKLGAGVSVAKFLELRLEGGGSVGKFLEVTLNGAGVSVGKFLAVTLKGARVSVRIANVINIFLARDNNKF